MTEPKPLSDEELREVRDHYTGTGVVRDDIRNLLATIHDRDATIRRRGELIAWVAGHSVLGVVVRALADKAPKSECGKNATEILAIVAGLEQKQ